MVTVDQLAPVGVGAEWRFGRAAEAVELLGVPRPVVMVDRLAPVGVGAEWRLGGAVEAVELCRVAELLGVPLTVEVPKNNEKRICEINQLHIKTLEGILIVIFKSHDIGQPLSRWCRLSMAGANCRWQICIADGRYTLSMAGLNY